MLKPARSSIACEFCRNSKIKCKNSGDNSKCERCLRLGRLNCIYRPKGYQQVKRSLKLKEDGVIVNKNKCENNYYSLNIKLPPKFLILKVINIFFSNQYNGIFQFIHKQKYLNYYKSIDKIDKKYLSLTDSKTEYDPILLLAILSICSRFEPSMCEIYGLFNENANPETFEPNFNLLESVKSNDSQKEYNTSNYFGYYSREIIKDFFDKPTIQRIQALTILSSHEWGNCNASRSYLYNGISVRMAIILGLNNPNSLVYRKVSSDSSLSVVDKAIKLESYRRTMWSVYMMDRANASGRNKTFAIRIEDIQIPLPCLEYEFLNGIQKKYLNYDKSLELLISNNYNHENNYSISFIGFQIFFFELWTKISKWCNESTKESDLLNKNSNFNKLVNDLNLLESKLPTEFKFSIENLTNNIKFNTIEQFGYLHCLIFLSKIFLYREIFYLIKIKENNESINLNEWWEYTKLLLKTVQKSSNLIKTLKSIKLIVEAPFLTFQIFTNSMVCLYFVAFSKDFKNLKYNSKKIDELKIEFKKLGETNIELLNNNDWKLGEKYYLITKELDKNNLKNYIIIDKLKNKIHDYGETENEDDEKDESIDTNITELIQEFGYEDWENFDMNNMLPGWNPELYS